MIEKTIEAKPLDTPLVPPRPDLWMIVHWNAEGRYYEGGVVHERIEEAMGSLRSEKPGARLIFIPGDKPEESSRRQLPTAEDVRGILGGLPEGMDSAEYLDRTRAPDEWAQIDRLTAENGRLRKALEDVDGHGYTLPTGYATEEQERWWANGVTSVKRMVKDLLAAIDEESSPAPTLPAVDG